MGRIKPQKRERGPRINVHETAKPSPNQMRPKFSLEHLQKSHCLSCCTKDEKAAFADRMHQLSQLTWQQIRQADRHGQGYEKIARSAIRTGIPQAITEEVDILSFRFFGKAPMVGFRCDEIFFVVWLDRDFTLYPHG